MEPAVGAWCGTSEVCFRLPDHDRRLSAVGLVQGVVPASPDFAYGLASRTWELRMPRPPLHRIEYKFELRYPDGGAEAVCDPDNPRRVGGHNRDMADTLRRQGYPVTFVEVPDAHNWTGWRDALDPHLTSLLQGVFS
jgi:hypothetical protein